MKYSLGWIPQPHDGRDIFYSAFNTKFPSLPSEVDLFPKINYILDQGQLGSCVGNGSSKALRLAMKNAGWHVDFQPSRLAIYYDGRRQEGTIDQDAGTIIRDAIKGLNKWGFADEKLWPYDISKFADQPTDAYFQEAKKNDIHLYAAIDNSRVENIKLALSHGSAVIFGMQVFSKFEEYTNGVIQVPDTTVEQFLGGHCMAFTGYSDDKEAFAFDNSWGTGWGESGRGWLSYNYATSIFVSDLWCIRLK